MSNRSGWSEARTAVCVPVCQETAAHTSVGSDHPSNSLLIQTNQLHLWHMECQQGQALPHLSLQPNNVPSHYIEVDAFLYYSVFLSPCFCCFVALEQKHKYVKDTPKAKYVFAPKQLLSDYQCDGNCPNGRSYCSLEEILPRQSQSIIALRKTKPHSRKRKEINGGEGRACWCEEGC